MSEDHEHYLDLDRPYNPEGFFCAKCGKWIKDQVSLRTPIAEKKPKKDE